MKKMIVVLIGLAGLFLAFSAVKKLNRRDRIGL